MFTSFMSVPRLYRLRACRKDASAEPPPTMGDSDRSYMTRFNSKSFSAFILLLTSLLPQAVWAAGEVANPPASSVLLLILFVLIAIGIKGNKRFFTVSGNNDQVIAI